MPDRRAATPTPDAPITFVMAPSQHEAKASTEGVLNPLNLRADLSHHCASVSTYIGLSEATMLNLKKELQVVVKEKELESNQKDLAYRKLSLTLKQLQDAEKDLSKCQSELDESWKNLEKCKKHFEVEKRQLSEDLMQDFQEQIFMTESQQYSVGYSDCSKGRRHRLGYHGLRSRLKSLYFSE